MIRKGRTPIDQVEFMRNLLAVLLLGAFIGAMGAFTVFKIPEENKDIITYMVGQLSGMALTVLGFYFINKVGADALDAKRAESTDKLADAVVAAQSTPSGTAEDPIQTEVINTPDNPANVTETKP